jgi:peptide/nickel transport system substrate-binding protein
MKFLFLPYSYTKLLDTFGWVSSSMRKDRQMFGCKRLATRGLRAGAAVSLALAAGSLAGCGGSGTASHGGAGKPVLTMGLTNYTATLNPAIAGGGDQSMPIDLAYQSLTHLEPNGDIGPGLATSWHYVGTTNTEFTFTLRQDARFSDGTPVTASAVKAWLDYAYFKAKASITGSLALKSIDTVGKWTVDLHLAAPNSLMPYLLSEAEMFGFIGSPKAIAHASTLGTGTDGAGPYIAVPSQSVAGSIYVFKPNPYYYDQSAVHFSKVVVKIITSPTTMIEAIKSGQINVAAGDITTAATAQGAGLNVITAPSGFVQILLLDRGPKTPDGSAANPLASVQVREALNYAINRHAVTQAIYGKYGVPTAEIGSSDGFVPGMQNYYPYAAGKARSLLTAAGYPKGFTLDVTSESAFGTLADPVLEAIAQEYKAIGVTLKITSTTTLPQWVTQVLGGSYESAGFVATAFAPLSEWYNYFLAPKGLENQHGWDDPTLDALARQGEASLAPGQYWRAMTSRIVSQADEIPVFNFDAFWYTAKNIGGLSFSANNGTPYPSEWYAR